MGQKNKGKDAPDSALARAHLTLIQKHVYFHNVMKEKKTSKIKIIILLYISLMCKEQIRDDPKQDYAEKY